MSRGRSAPDTASRKAASRAPTAAATTAHSAIGAFAPSPRSSSLHRAWLIPARIAASAWVIPATVLASLNPMPMRTATVSARARPRITSWVARAAVPGAGDVGRGGFMGADVAGGVGILPPSFAGGLHADLSPPGPWPTAPGPVSAVKSAVCERGTGRIRPPSRAPGPADD